MIEKQHTIGKSVSLSGPGLHTGVNVTLTLNPAEENFGYKFQRIDLPDKPIIKALVDNVVYTQRGTVLQEGEAKISTAEHCLSALCGMNIDNCLIEVDGPEAPILDGSSHFFTQAIKEAGVVEQSAEKEYFEVREKMIVGDPETGSYIIALPDNHLSVQTMISFDKSMVLAGVNTAPWLCNDLNINGFNDWYLPSADELLYMYNNLYSKGIGGFKNTNYWSSSLDNRGLIYINFSTGDEKGTIVFDSDKKQVRAIRQF